MVDKVVNGARRTLSPVRPLKKTLINTGDLCTLSRKHGISARDSRTSRTPSPMYELPRQLGTYCPCLAVCCRRARARADGHRNSASPRKAIDMPSRAITGRMKSFAPNGGTTPARSRRRTVGHSAMNSPSSAVACPRDQTKTLPSQWAVTHLYLAHFAVSDLSKGRFHYADKMSRAGLGQGRRGAGSLHVWIDRWSAESHRAGAVWTGASDPPGSGGRHGHPTHGLAGKTTCRAWHRRNQPQRIGHRTSLPLLFLHQTGHDRQTHDRE